MLCHVTAQSCQKMFQISKGNLTFSLIFTLAFFYFCLQCTACNFCNVRIGKIVQICIICASVQSYLVSNSDLLAVFTLALALLFLFAFFALSDPTKSGYVRSLVCHNFGQLADHQLCRLDHSLINLFHNFW